MTTEADFSGDVTDDKLDGSGVDYTDRPIALFAGDSGTLNLGQRATLIKILKQPFISAAEHPEEWETLMEGRLAITARLHDLLLDLRLDLTSRVAYKVRAQLNDDLAAPSVLRNTRWTASQTALLVVLRERLRLRAIPADPVYVDLDELVVAMASILPKTVDETRPRKVTEAALDSLTKLGIVKLAIGSDDRYQINPVLESLLPVAKLRQLLDGLTAINGAAKAAASNGTDALGAPPPRVEAE